MALRPTMAALLALAVVAETLVGSHGGFGVAFLLVMLAAWMGAFRPGLRRSAAAAAACALVLVPFSGGFTGVTIRQVRDGPMTQAFVAGHTVLPSFLGRPEAGMLAGLGWSIAPLVIALFLFQSGQRRVALACVAMVAASVACIGLGLAIAPASMGAGWAGLWLAHGFALVGLVLDQTRGRRSGPRAGATLPSS